MWNGWSKVREAPNTNQNFAPVSAAPYGDMASVFQDSELGFQTSIDRIYRIVRRQRLKRTMPIRKVSEHLLA
jgi:hypothetical protein